MKASSEIPGKLTMLIYLRTLMYPGLFVSPLLAQAGTEVAGINVDESCNMDNR